MSRAAEHLAEWPSKQWPLGGRSKQGVESGERIHWRSTKWRPVTPGAWSCGKGKGTVYLGEGFAQFPFRWGKSHVHRGPRFLSAGAPRRIQPAASPGSRRGGGSAGVACTVVEKSAYFIATKLLAMKHDSIKRIERRRAEECKVSFAPARVLCYTVRKQRLAVAIDQGMPNGHASSVFSARH